MLLITAERTSYTQTWLPDVKTKTLLKDDLKALFIKV